MKNGVEMAVAEADGVAAGYCIEVVSLDDASPQSGKWDGAVEAETKKAVAIPSPSSTSAPTTRARPRSPSPSPTGRTWRRSLRPTPTRAHKEAGAAPGEPEIYRPAAS